MKAILTFPYKNNFFFIPSYLFIFLLFPPSSSLPSPSCSPSPPFPSSSLSHILFLLLFFFFLFLFFLLLLFFLPLLFSFFFHTARGNVRSVRSGALVHARANSHLHLFGRVSRHRPHHRHRSYRRLLLTK